MIQTIKQHFTFREVLFVIYRNSFSQTISVTALPSISSGFLSGWIHSPTSSLGIRSGILSWMNRMFSDVKIVAGGCTRIIPATAGMITRLISACVALLFLEPLFAVVYLAAGIVMIAAIGIVRKRFKILHKEAFDRSGLIYGVGHAVYSLSDPRAILLEDFARKLAAAKGLTDEYNLYQTVASKGLDLIRKERRIYKGVCVNVDFYSGFLYSMLNIPVELYTPIFAMARVVGWCAHRMEQLINEDKIMRPAYQSVCEKREYVPIDQR